MAGAVRSIGINSEVLYLVEYFIEMLYLKGLSGRYIDVVLAGDLAVRRERAGVLRADKVRILHDIAAGGLLSRCHDGNRICRKQ